MVSKIAFVLLLGCFVVCYTTANYNLKRSLVKVYSTGMRIGGYKIAHFALSPFMYLMLVSNGHNRGRSAISFVCWIPPTWKMHSFYSPYCNDLLFNVFIIHKRIRCIRQSNVELPDNHISLRNVQSWLYYIYDSH